MSDFYTYPGPTSALANCPGNCDHCDELSAIEAALADLDFEALLQTHLKVGE